MSNDDARVPIDAALPGMKIHALDEGEVPLAAFLLIKVMDKDGNPTWSFRTSEALNREELLGALTIQVELVKQSLLEDWDSDE